MTDHRPRLLYILHAYNNKGGTEEHTRHLIQGLKDQYEIFVVTPQSNEILLINNDNVIAQFQSPQVPWPITPLEWESAEIATEKILSKVKPSLIHVQHFFNWPLSILSKVQTAKVPTVLSLHDYYLLSPYFTFQGQSELATVSPAASKEQFGGDITLYLQTRRKYFSEVLKDFSRFITPSQFLSDALAKVYPLGFQVIEHGIPFFEPWPTHSFEDKVRFGYIGSLLPQKGWKTLLEAFRELRKERDDIELHIYGSGDGVDEDALRSEKTITFHGRYEQNDLRSICRAIDVAVIPSEFHETFCLVLSEMWQGNLPVAVADMGALGQRVTEGVNGKKFTAGDKEDIQRVLRWYATERSWREWNLPQPKLLDAMVSEYSMLYRELLGNS